jgi:predicted AAA+ superfamily ATPase
VNNANRVVGTVTNFHLLVTGSYLGIIIGNRNFFLPAGDLHTIQLTSITFEEYLNCKGERERFSRVDLFGNSNENDYFILNKLYHEYLKVGGYPQIVSMHIKTNDLDSIKDAYLNIYNTVISECKINLDNICFDRFTDICKTVAGFMLSEQKGKTIDYRNYILVQGNSLDVN